ncbi:chloride channel protein [Dubosiella newyorkensis]|uniref:chloride channel protein n=1 Tax=Dubosiella newyorkensis TaxID=1862672 RepID=UPI00272BA668|nr:chloride channel protein [Dubosiella newyorkensis]
MNQKELFKKALQRTFMNYEELAVLTLVGIVIGLCVSLFEVLFGYGLEYMIEIHHRTKNWLLLILPLAGLLIVYLFQHTGKDCMKGMNLVFEVSQGISKRIPKRMVPLMILGTWISNLVGASVGREGVAMQIGAAISDTFSKPFLKYKDAKSIFLVVGMAAGFSGLFGTPFTAIFFAMEVLVAGVLKYRAMAPTISSSFSAAWLSSKFGIYKKFENIQFPFEITWKMLLALVGLGILFGIVGGLFAYTMKKVKRAMKRKIPDPYKRIFYGGIVIAIVLFVWNQGRYSLLGENLIDAALRYGTIYWYDWIGKFVCTIFCLSIGFMGGEVTPLFAIGSSLGFMVASFFGFPPVMGAALGYSAVFGAGTNTFLAPVMIGMEIFGFQYFPLFFIVCAVAHIVNRHQSIYALQKREG